ncbi:hypothetical protein Pla144_39320 [Bythopirellula polymerisocia]|uniref:Cytochrome c-552/4 domain-containing protein n=2 Tax=Bythopirellula polymerisocia TaxID=2528003 RepID=A0A5C6CJK1_9BACT|nr:hypothetical protein Pla144_39320 [Bythopirellula polymerisocia]
MERKSLGIGVRPWLGGAVVVAISALVGYWHAQPQSAPESSRYSDIVLVDHESDRVEQIEQALAQAGCPGWMVLAGEGPSALGAEVVPPEIRTISADIPRVSYPQPLRVASRVATGASSTAVVATPGESNDPDDLLDGTADLLWNDDAAPEKEAAPVEAPEEKPPQEDSVDKTPAVNKPDDTLPLREPSFPVDVPEPPGKNEPQALPVPLPATAEEIAPPAQSPFAPPPSPANAAPHSMPSHATGDTQSTGKSYCEFVADSLYPSAFACATCHEKLFEEWSVSSHAYAAVSPMFHKFEQKINDISQATIGYFCYRCHSPVGTSLGISRAAPLWDLPQVAREGVTCIACHRVNQRYGKVNGERRIEPGNIFAPVYGSIGGSGVAEVIAHKNEFKVKTSSQEQGPGQDIHIAGCYFDQLSKPEFCVSCHQVAVQPGIKLEVVWEQYRASPACKKGISCQDCHMGRLPGVPSGYKTGPAAIVNGKTVNDHRKHANHVFYGPGYSIAHPGVFPFNKDALRWSMLEWLQFDYRAGWGTEEFEKAVEDGLLYATFPPVWSNVDDRYDAREVVEANLKKLGQKDISRHQIMENGSHVDGPFFDKPLARGRDLRFHYIVTNRNDGHNMPSGSLGAQPQLWANVVLIGPRGQRLWESGYTDRWGDVADIHSEDVRNKRIPYDWQLFNLQTMFLITGATGTDREFFLPVNIDIDQLPYLRPGAQPISVINHPPFIRMEGRSLAPLGSRRAPYKVPAELLQEPGCYRLSFRLRMRTQPIYFMRFCDATLEMQRAMNEGITDFHLNSYEFEIR